MTSRHFILAALLILPALSHAEPFNAKSLLTIPFAGTVFLDDPGENVDVAGDVSLKVILSRRTGPVKMKAIAKLKNVTATGQTSGDEYAVRGQSKMQLTWPTDVTGVDVGVAMEGEPIPGIDVRFKNLVVAHVDTDANTGAVTGSSAVVQAVPASASTTPALEVSN
jgi:hypothetical protein